MKKIVIIFTFFCTLVLMSFIRTSNRLIISGSVFSDTKEANKKISGMYIFVKGDNKFITGYTIDSLRNFALSFIPENQPSFDFYMAGKGVDTFLLKSFTRFDSDEIRWNIKLVVTPKGFKINEEG